MNIFNKLLTLLLATICSSCEQDYVQDDELRDIYTNISGNYLMVDNGSSETSFNLFVDAAWSSSISYEGTQSGWLQLSKPSGSLSTQITISTTSNLGRSRTANVTFSDGLTNPCTVTVVQAADPNYMDNNVQSYNIIGSELLYENSEIDSSQSYIVLSYINGDGSDCTISAVASESNEVDGISVDLSGTYAFGVGDGTLTLPLSGIPTNSGSYIFDLTITTDSGIVYSSTIDILVSGDLEFTDIALKNCYFYVGGTLNATADTTTITIAPYLTLSYNYGDGVSQYRATINYTDNSLTYDTTGVNLKSVEYIDGTFSLESGQITFPLASKTIPAGTESFDVTVKVVGWDGVTEGDTLYEDSVTIPVVDLEMEYNYDSTLYLDTALTTENGITISYNDNYTNEYAKWQLWGATGGLSGTGWSYSTLSSSYSSSIYVKPGGTPNALGEVSVSINFFIYPEGETSYASSPRVKFFVDNQTMTYTVNSEALLFDTPTFVGSKPIVDEQIENESTYIEIPFSGADGESYEVSMSYTSGSDVGLTLGSASGTFSTASGSIIAYISGTPAASGDAELSIDIKVGGSTYDTKSANFSVGEAVTGEVSFSDIDLIDCYFYAGGNLQGKADDGTTAIAPYLVLNYSNGDGSTGYKATLDYNDGETSTTTGVNIDKSGDLTGTFEYGDGKITFQLGQANVPYDAKSFDVSVKVVEWDGAAEGNTIYEDEVTIEIIDLGIQYTYNNALTLDTALSAENAVTVSYNENCKGEYAKYQLVAGTTLGMSGSLLTYETLANSESSSFSIAPRNTPTSTGEATFTFNFYIYPEGQETYLTRPRVKFAVDTITYTVSE